MLKLMHSDLLLNKVFGGVGVERLSPSDTLSVLILGMTSGVGDEPVQGGL